MQARDKLSRIKDARESLRLLKEGNKRYLEDKSEGIKNHKILRTQLKDIQNPFAVILACSDSRIVPEIIFDQDIGDIFSLSNAGNIVDSTTLGSMEYALKELEVPLIVVCGHTNCGAVNAAFAGLKFPKELQSIMDHINSCNETCLSPEDLVLANIKNNIKIISNNPRIKQYRPKIIGALYNIESGKVKWFI